MDQARKNEILDTMVDISNEVDSHLDTNLQMRGNMTYYKDFQFGNSGLGEQNVYIVETPLAKEAETGDNRENNIAIYEIYDKDRNLIATVSGDGKIHFAPEYLEKLKEINPQYFEQLNLEDITFNRPEELQENDMVISKEELQEHEAKNRLGTNKEEKIENKQEEKTEQKEEEKDQEGEKAKKQEAAEALGMDVSEIKSICTINPREKITDKYNLIDIMPEADGYDEISIICSSPNEQSHGRFTMIGVSKNGEGKASSTISTPLTSIEPVEGTSTGKNVISVNEEGTKVTEKQVQGLFRINSRGRNDGISVSIGNYGMMDVDYVSNVMDKEHRRATPIRTKGPENVRTANAEVRENAGDSIEEVEQEGRIFRAKEEEGIDPQTLDGIDVDRADGQSMTLDDLKESITEKTLEQGEMSKGETREFIKSEIAKSGLELSDGEIDHTTDEIEANVLDKSRFGSREYRGY